jgi:hypothetical protein
MVLLVCCGSHSSKVIIQICFFENVFMKNTLEEWFLSIGRTKYKVVTPKPRDFGIHDIFPCPGSHEFCSGMILEKLPYMWHESEVHMCWWRSEWAWLFMKMKTSVCINSNLLQELTSCPKQWFWNVMLRWLMVTMWWEILSMLELIALGYCNSMFFRWGPCVFLWTWRR